MVLCSSTRLIQPVVGEARVPSFVFCPPAKGAVSATQICAYLFRVPLLCSSVSSHCGGVEKGLDAGLYFPSLRPAGCWAGTVLHVLSVGTSELASGDIQTRILYWYLTCKQSVHRYGLKYLLVSKVLSLQCCRAVEHWWCSHHFGSFLITNCLRLRRLSINSNNQSCLPCHTMPPVALAEC